MAEAVVIKRDRRPGTAVMELNTKLAREVEAAVKEAERAQAGEQPETRVWSYRVPQAGVRYYSF